MCKRNFRGQIDSSMECVRGSRLIKKTKTKQHGMCKRNFLHKNQDSTWCVRETPQTKKKKKKKKKKASMGCVRETPSKTSRQHGMCKRNSPHKNEGSMGWVRDLNSPHKNSRHGMCARNSPHKNEARAGCIREIPRIKMKPAWHV